MITSIATKEVHKIDVVNKPFKFNLLFSKSISITKNKIKNLKRDMDLSNKSNL